MLTFHDRCNLPSRDPGRSAPRKGAPIRIHPTPTDPLASGGGCSGESACASGTLTKGILDAGKFPLESIPTGRPFICRFSIFSSFVSLMVVKFAHIFRWMDFVCSCCCCCYVFLVRSKPSIESRFCSGAIGGSSAEFFYALLRIGTAEN